MANDIFVEALKEAIISAFFNQKQIYNSQTGYSDYYGGQVAGLVKEILQSKEMEKIIKEMAESIASQKEKIKIEIGKSIKEEIFKEVKKQITDSNYYISDWVRNWIKSSGKEIAEEELKNNKKINNLIKEKIGVVDITNLQIEKSVGIKIINL
jgi:hypothetical protein